MIVNQRKNLVVSPFADGARALARFNAQIALNGEAA
jgi:hypothetical protein